MKKLIMLISVLFAFGCNKHKEEQSKSLSVDSPSRIPGYQYTTINIDKWNQEYLRYDSVLMNGKVPLVTDTNTLFGFLGKPQKVIPIPTTRNNCWLLKTRHGNMANYLVYGNTVFEQCGKDVIVNTIDFESTNMELTSSKINLKKGLKPIEIQRVFPESGRLLGGMGGNAWSGNIMVSASKPFGGIHTVWFFIFEGEKLERLVLFTAPFMADFIN